MPALRRSQVHGACPLHIDILTFIDPLTAIDFDDALATRLERSPFPGVCGHEMRAAVDEIQWATDDGSVGLHGTEVDLMRDWRAHCRRAPAFAHVIGPITLMRAVASLNPIMVDGTGTCAGCRVSTSGTPVFACVDGPEFHAHPLDFDQLALRNRAYVVEEKRVIERHECLAG